MKTTSPYIKKFPEEFYADYNTMFIKGNMRKTIEALKYIDSQLSDGYVDLGLHDETELKIIEYAIKEYKEHHNIK